MKLTDVPTEKLIEAIRATETVTKPDSPSLVALRRELERRELALLDRARKLPPQPKDAAP